MCSRTNSKIPKQLIYINYNFSHSGQMTVMSALVSINRLCVVYLEAVFFCHCYWCSIKYIERSFMNELIIFNEKSNKKKTKNYVYLLMFLCVFATLYSKPDIYNLIQVLRLIRHNWADFNLHLIWRRSRLVATKK